MPSGRFHSPHRVFSALTKPATRNPQQASSVLNPRPATRNPQQVLSISTRNALSGFTLLEMLLAITVLVLIVTIIGGAMRLGYRSADRGERKIEYTERLRRSIEIVESQIQSSLPLVLKEGAETTAYFSGGRKGLTISTNYSVWDGRRGYVLAEYAVRGESSGKESLFVTEKPLGMETGSETVLLKDCDSVEFSYLEKGLTEEDARWVEEWNSEEAGPERIKISIRYRAWKYSLVIPIRVGRIT